MSNEIKIGQYLTALREQEGLKQNELAKRISWSPAVLSRVENGERPITEDELEIVLRGIGVSDVERVKQVIARQWEILPEPAFTDQDLEVLWDAEQTATEISALAKRPDVKAFFQVYCAAFQAKRQREDQAAAGWAGQSARWDAQEPSQKGHLPTSVADMRRGL